MLPLETKFLYYCFTGDIFFFLVNSTLFQADDKSIKIWPHSGIMQAGPKQQHKVPPCARGGRSRRNERRNRALEHT